MTTPEETYRRGSVVLRGPDPAPDGRCFAAADRTQRGLEAHGPLACSADPVRVRRRV